MCLGSKALPSSGAKLTQIAIERHPSPNFGQRRGVKGPSLIVLHYTAMPNLEAALERLSDPKHEVSAHYLIDQQGGVIQLVAEAQRAWHAGAGSWGAYRDINSASIGVELCNAGNHGFPMQQIEALKTLITDVKQRWAISAANIIGHSDMSPGRKFDPGRRFPWQTFAKKGLGVWPHKIASKAPDWDIFKHAAKIFGYCPPSNDKDGWSAVLYAFRLRFLPDQEGELSMSDMGVIISLANNWPTHL